MLLVTEGYDSDAVKGGGFHDPEADAAFVTELKAGVPANIEVRERKTHIEDPQFATEAAELLISLINQQKGI